MQGSGGWGWGGGGRDHWQEVSSANDEDGLGSEEKKLKSYQQIKSCDSADYILKYIHIHTYMCCDVCTGSWWFHFLSGYINHQWPGSTGLLPVSETWRTPSVFFMTKIFPLDTRIIFITSTGSHWCHQHLRHCHSDWFKHRITIGKAGHK